jgi:hypothetical protein
MVRSVVGRPGGDNVAGVTRRIRTGDEVEVRAGSGTVELLAPA